MWEIRIASNGVKRWVKKSSKRGGAARRTTKPRKATVGGRSYPGRKAPGASATLYGVGTLRKGMNGKMWVVRKASNGVKRWVPSNGKKTVPKRKPRKPAKKTASKKRKSAKKQPSRKKSAVRKRQPGKLTTMTKPAIIASLPDIKRLPKDKEFGCWMCEERSTADVRRYYGPRATLLTVAIAKKLGPRKVQVLMGQNWSALDTADRRERASKLEALELLRFNAVTDELSVRQSGFSFKMYEYDGDLVTGSGADPVYVFLAK
jgi:hypothetical protein